MTNYSKEWAWWEPYQKASKAEKIMLESLNDVLYEVQYAPKGLKSKARRDASLEIITAILTAYKVHHKTKNIFK